MLLRIMKRVYAKGETSFMRPLKNNFLVFARKPGVFLQTQFSSILTD